MATSVGWLLAGMLLPAVAVGAAGPVIAAFQFALLNRRIRDAWRWFVASSIGWLAGWVIVQVLVPAALDFLGGLVLGPAVGIAQWLVLRPVQWPLVVGRRRGLRRLALIPATSCPAWSPGWSGVRSLLSVPKPRSAPGRLKEAQTSVASMMTACGTTGRKRAAE
jgi:hypothetical protein